MARTSRFLGKGIAFPLRINEATGGVQITEGIRNPSSVMLQYVMERWTIREDTREAENHIAESISHILLTSPTEHDTLPEFGSNIKNILFEPNHPSFHTILEHWLQWSTERWEKRARVPVSDGVKFLPSGTLTDQGRLPVVAKVDFIPQQAEMNLVAPFVTSRQARGQEYPVVEVDESGHDYPSRYYGSTVLERAGICYNRLRKPTYLPPARDDEFYTVKHGDTWLLISWELYRDIRYWPYLAQMWVDDQAEDGATRDSTIDTTGDPVMGTVLRVPSRTRMLMEVSVD